MVFGTNVNAAQRIIIDNYLSAKYNIPLTSGKIYTQDDPANGNYDFDVAGIGRIDANDINADAKGAGMVEMLNPSNLADNEFLFWGDDGGRQWPPIPPTYLRVYKPGLPEYGG